MYLLSVESFADYPEEQGNKVFAGSIQSRPGEKRSDLKGGFYLGEKNKDFRGVQLLSQGCSANAYLRERSKYGQSLLVTLQPNPLTVNCTSVVGSNTVNARVNNFDNEFFSKDAIVDFGLQRYRIIKVIDRNTVSLCRVVKKRCENFKFEKKIRDNLVLPSFYYKSKARVEKNIITFTSGDYPPKFAKRVFKNKLLSVKIDKKWFFLKKRLDRFRFSFLSDDDGKNFNTEEKDVLMRFQPTYTVELVLKRTSGQGLEESWMVRSDYDGWRYKSSGSGVAINKPHIFRIGKYDLLTLSSDSLKSQNKIITPEIVFGSNNNSNIRLLSGTGDPDGEITADVGSIYTRRDGQPGKTLYIKESGNDSLGWRVVK